MVNEIQYDDAHAPGEDGAVLVDPDAEGVVGVDEAENDQQEHPLLCVWLVDVRGTVGEASTITSVLLSNHNGPTCKNSFERMERCR